MKEIKMFMSFEGEEPTELVEGARKIDEDSGELR